MALAEAQPNPPPTPRGEGQAGLELSVAICAHDPRRHFLERVLGGLKEQSLDTARWELLLIDNASKEPLRSLYDLSWHPQARYVLLEQLGIAVARQRALQEARGAFTIFVDDDNVLDRNYLAEALRIAEEWPQLGVWGGSTEPEFEVPPPDRLKNYLAVLALRTVDRARWSNVATCSDAEPWGAGMCIRSSVAAAYCAAFDASPIRLGRRAGISMIPGEDTEMCVIACNLGLGMGIFPELRLMHLVPQERVSEDYILRATEGIQTGILMIEYKWRGTVPKSLLAPKALLLNIAKLLTKRGMERKMLLVSMRARSKARAAIAAAYALPSDGG